MEKLLTDEFLAQYGDFPEQMNELGKFVYYRTYSRFVESEGRRETWKQTVKRSTEYNVGLAIEHMKKNGMEIDYDKQRREAEQFFDSMFNINQFLSGRTLWVGGAEGGVGDKYPLANFNCSFLNIESWDDFGDMFYLLMVGTGVGFRSSKKMAQGLHSIRDDVEIIHEPYTRRYPLVKEPNTQTFFINDDTKAVIHIGDSKEGWVDALRSFLRIMTAPEYEHVKTISLYYDYVRPKGTKLKTFGGTASGHEPLKEMFEGIEQVVHNLIDPSLAPLERIADNRVKIRPVHVLDIGNLIGNNVVIGGVRRTAEIFLFDADDYESMLAKYGINGIWDQEQHNKVVAELNNMGLHDQANILEDLPVYDPNARPIGHRRMSNNSITFTQKPQRDFLHLIFEIMKMEGEPGFVNMEEASRRRPNAQGLNPCVEIILDTYGVCNLTTLNFVQFVQEDGTLDMEGLLDAQRKSARAGLRMTLVDLEIPHWDEVQKRDRLLGTSVTGVKDAMAMLGYNEEQERKVIQELGRVSREEADRYAKELRVTSPLLTTAVKPEGTISQVAGGVSSGLHYSHAPYFIRRIRINAEDPLANAAIEMGWTVNPEVGTSGETYEERMNNANTLVIDFPVASGADKTKDDASVKDQFKTYFKFQRNYTEHNSSNTISVRPGEWGDAEEEVYNGWDDFVGVSFLQLDGGTYELAPYEKITKEEYEAMKAEMADFDPKILEKYETGEDFDLTGAEGCEGGACPIR